MTTIETIYIDFLNKEKGFKEDRKYFKEYNKLIKL
jgi:hypothetical protein